MHRTCYVILIDDIARCEALQYMDITCIGLNTYRTYSIEETIMNNEMYQRIANKQ